MGGDGSEPSGVPQRIKQNKIEFMQFYAKLCIFMQKGYAKRCSLASTMSDTLSWVALIGVNFHIPV